MRALKRIKRRWPLGWRRLFFCCGCCCWPPIALWPLPLREVTPARVVVAEDGTPLWRFADAQGVWRYPVTLADVSPRYLQALIQYEDRWFWDHPGVNPFSIVRAAWQDLTSGRVISGGSTLTMQVARPARSASPNLRRQATSAMARAAAGVASVKKRDPHALPQPGAVRRYAAGDRRSQLGLSR